MEDADTNGGTASTAIMDETKRRLEDGRAGAVAGCGLREVAECLARRRCWLECRVIGRGCKMRTPAVTGTVLPYW